MSASFAEASEAAHGEALAAVLDVARAEVAVVAGERRFEVVERQAVAGELVRIGVDVELLHHAAPRVDVGDAGQVSAAAV